MTTKLLKANPIALPASIAYVLAYLLWQALGTPGDAAVIGDLAIVPPTAIAAVACELTARALAGNRRLVWGWRLLALASLAFLVGELVQMIYEIDRSGYTFPSLADPFFLSFYPLTFAAIVTFTGGRRSRSIRTLLDAATITIGAVVVIWFVVLAPSSYGNLGGPFASIVAIAYPVSDLVLVCALAGLLADPPTSTARPTLVLLTAGSVLYVVADLIYDHLLIHDLYAGGNPVDTLWIMAVFTFALAAATQRLLLTTATEDQPPRRRRVAFGPYLSLAAVFGLLIASQWKDAFFPDFGLTLAAALIAAVIALRQILAKRELIALHAELRAAHLELAAIAATDPVTGLPNQRALTASIDAELARRLRTGRPCSLLFLDIDHFKELNDTHGHAAGDAALREFGEVVAAELRAVDAFGRWGGEEFVALLPEIELTAATPVAERIRAAVARHEFSAQVDSSLTVSIGVATSLDAGREALLAAADGALYEAKRGGRDRVEVAPEPGRTRSLTRSINLLHI